jgi:hypothetical protein
MPTPTPIAIFLVFGSMPPPEPPFEPSLVARPFVADAAAGLVSACVIVATLPPLITDVSTTINVVDGLPWASVLVMGVVDAAADEELEEPDEDAASDDELADELGDEEDEDEEDDEDEDVEVVDAAAPGLVVAAAPPPPGARSDDTAAPTPLTAPFPPPFPSPLGLGSARSQKNHPSAEPSETKVVSTKKTKTKARENILGSVWRVERKVGESRLRRWEELWL